MRLAEHLTFRFVLGASNVCLVGENPDLLSPGGIVRDARGLWSYDYGHA